MKRLRKALVLLLASLLVFASLAIPCAAWDKLVTYVSDGYITVIPTTGYTAPMIFAGYEKDGPLKTVKFATIQNGRYYVPIEEGIDVSELNWKAFFVRTFIRTPRYDAEVIEFTPKSDVPQFLCRNCFTYGDSITAGTRGGYVKYFESICGVTVTNYGVSAYRSYEMLKCITGGQFGYSTKEIPTCKDYSKCDLVTIMIGTNNGAPPSDWAADVEKVPYTTEGYQLKDMPFTYGGKEITTAEEYYDMLPHGRSQMTKDIVRDLTFAVEWIRWKNPAVRIFLITPPLNKNNDMQEMKKLYLALGEKLGVNVVNAIDNVGFTKDNFEASYSYDGVHFNEAGNELWGTYVANAINAS